jgi:hypothetical protein
MIRVPTVAHRASLPLALALAAACADPEAPLPPAEDVLLVVNSIEASLSVVPVDAPDNTLRSRSRHHADASGRLRWVLRGGADGLDHSVAVVNLQDGAVERTIPLAANSFATGSAIVDDLIAY